MEKKELSHDESLAIINSMISRAKDSFHGTGVGTMMWGVVIAVCSLVKLSEVHFGYKLPFDIYLLALFAILPQIIISAKEKKSQKARSFEDTFVSPIWIGFGVCTFLLVLIINILFANYIPLYNEYKALTGHAPAFSLREYIMPLFLLLYGLPTFITGVGCHFKPMFWGGIVCWVSCVLAVFTEYRIDLLLTAFSAIAAWFIPGLMMEKEYRRYKKSGGAMNV
ncbi:MAG: hypothetical protein EOO06_15255 [Chitinophagaceae bacterium]|nr:MAG: hypothetical protein EOO06_15255 [Chitinophagaceae bacterium]